MGEVEGSLPRNRNDVLLPFTKLVLAVSAIVQIVFGVANLLTDKVWNQFLWTAPLPPWPAEVGRFSALNYLATAIAALYALSTGRWLAARVYFAFSFPYIVMSVIAALVSAADPGVPLIMWLYVALSAIYLPVLVHVWIRQRRA